MNYGKYKFEQAKREKEAKKKQKVYEVKEIRVTPNTEEHDFNFKAKNARKFLEDGCKVKITVRFRGRELSYTKLGENLLNKFAEELSDIANVDKNTREITALKAGKTTVTASLSSSYTLDNKYTYVKESAFALDDTVNSVKVGDDECEITILTEDIMNRREY